MIDPSNPAFAARANPGKGPTVQQSNSTIARRNGYRMSLAASRLSVDRDTITRFIFILTLLSVAYLISGPSTIESEWGVVNAVCPIVLCLASIWAGYAIITKDPRTIWTPIPWFALTTALNCGIGPLLYVFGPDNAIEDKNSYWPVGPAELWRTNLLNAISVLTICVSFSVTARLLERARIIDGTESPTSASTDRAKRAALIFLALGLPLRYFLVVPFVLGTLGFVLPGSVFALDSLAKLALFMLAYLGTKRQGGWRTGFWILFFAEVGTSFLELSKHAILLPFIMAALGRFLANRRIKELAFSGMGILAIYVVLSPVVTWTRLQLTEEYGHYDLSTASARLATASQAFNLYAQGALVVSDSEHSSWARCCYADQQTAAMQLYDEGVVGDSFQYAFYSWIPRFIWPDKPIMNLGQQFTILVQGYDGNSTGAGTFGEAYWNGGWLMVVLACGYIGIIFAFIVRVTLSVLARSDWELLPCAFLGIMMGLRMDGWFAPTYITGFLMYLAYYFIIRCFLTLGENRD